MSITRDATVDGQISQRRDIASPGVKETLRTGERKRKEPVSSGLGWRERGAVQ